MDGGAWWAIVHGVAKSRTRLSDFTFTFNLRQGFPGGSVVKNPPVMQETWVRSWVRKIPWRRKCPPTPVFFPGKSQTEEPEGLQPMESLKSPTRTWLLSNNKS